MSKKVVVIPPIVPELDVDQRWLTVKDSAKYLRRSVQFVRALIHSGDLKASELGGFIIDRNDLDKLILSRKRTVGAYRKGTRPWVKARLAKERAA